MRQRKETKKRKFLRQAKSEEEKDKIIEERKERIKKYNREYMRKYYKNNREKMLKIQKKWQQSNAEKVQAYQKSVRDDEERGEKVREYFRKRRHRLRTPAQRRAYNKKVKAGDTRVGPQKKKDDNKEKEVST